MAVAGMAGGLVLAVTDFLPSWLYVHEPIDRAWFGLRLLALLPPLGALAGLLVVAIDRAARPALRRSRRPRLLAPLPVLLVLSPALVALALTLFEGGRASRLPMVPLLVLGAAILLLAISYVALRVTRRLARTRRGPALIVGALSIAIAVAIGVASRLLYPRHYEAIHGALTALALVAASLGGWLLLARRARAAPPTAAIAIAAVVSIGLALASLPRDHDGRAALLSPRAAHARAVMLAAAPLLYAWPEPARPRAPRPRPPALDGLPVAPEAHLVLVTIDALRADHLGAYGYARRAGGRPLSLTIDRLAAEGVLFERAWTPTPRSSYAITSLMTGVALQPRAANGPAPRVPTLAEELGEAGLYTAGLYPDGIFFHDGARLGAYRDAQLGFTRRDAEYRDAESLTDAALAELDDLSRRGEPRAFLWVHYFDVHEPYEERALGDAPLDRYDGEIRNVDRALARLLDRIAALRRPVVLVLSADHGEEFLDHGGRFHGGSLYEEQLRVPLIVRAPGLAPRRVAAPVSLLDLAPTLRGLLGAGDPASGDGVDLRALMVGRADARAPVIATEAGMRAVLRWPYKLIEDRRVGGVELFDLAADPRERRSLASARPDLVEALRAF